MIQNLSTTLQRRSLKEENAEEALIDRVVYLGFEVRVGLTQKDGSAISVQVPLDEAERLELTAGQIVYARASRQRVFEEKTPPPVSVAS